MSGLLYQEQFIKDLEYKLLTVTEFKQQLNILVSKEVIWQGMLVSFFIIGSSHKVEVNLGSEKLIEILACVKLEKQTGLLVNKNLIERKKINYYHQIKNNLDYNFKLKVINFTNQENYQDFNKSLTELADNKLVYVFPKTKAVTSLEIFKEKEQLSWITYHSYSTQQQIVKTITTLKLKEAN